ncbi:PD40 domain-containing protein [Candidatus Babeliales bacterium]|nr:PD40 domain-containing protein [Candidatus Babeliales bacterium]
MREKKSFLTIVTFICCLLATSSMSAWSLFKREKQNQPQAISLDAHVTAEKYSKLKSLFLCQGDESLLQLCKIICDDLDFTDQFEVELKKSTQKVNNLQIKKAHVRKLFKKGTSLLFILEQAKNSETKLVAKDTSSNATVFEKQFSFNNSKLVSQAHELSAELLTALTGDRGVCLTSIAYCKMLAPRHKIICVADYACKQERVVVGTRAVNVAPSWHTKAPVLFYSQITNTKHRLMSLDLRTKKNSVVCSYQGLNMQPSFSRDGSKAVICLSGGQGNSELYWYDQNVCKSIGHRVFKQLTKNGSHNVSPCLLDDDNLIFCSDFGTGLPQIYHMNKKDREIRRLTGGKGYCAAPSFCQKTKMIVYTRPVTDSTFQLFTMSLDNLESSDERQITFGEGNKHEPSWSPCGRYIVFSCDKVDANKKRIPQVAALNYKSGKMRILTSSLEPKSFPRWWGQLAG